MGKGEKKEGGHSPVMISLENQRQHICTHTIYLSKFLTLLRKSRNPSELLSPNAQQSLSDDTLTTTLQKFQSQKRLILREREGGGRRGKDKKKKRKKRRGN